MYFSAHRLLAASGREVLRAGGFSPAFDSATLADKKDW